MREGIGLSRSETLHLYLAFEGVHEIYGSVLRAAHAEKQPKIAPRSDSFAVALFFISHANSDGVLGALAPDKRFCPYQNVACQDCSIVRPGLLHSAAVTAVSISAPPVFLSKSKQVL